MISPSENLMKISQMVFVWDFLPHLKLVEKEQFGENGQKLQRD
jgi:hypothetical protein